MRKFVINVNGNSYEVEVDEVTNGAQAPRPVAPVVRPAATQNAPTPAPAPVQKVESKVVAASEGQEIVDSPMPGNIWKILVKEGQEVKENDVLLILEAMKMENDITAPRDGVVASIVTTEGAAVNTGDKLVIMN